MNIQVSEDKNEFFLAYEEWLPVEGHEIKVGNHRFCAAILEGEINVSEVLSGMKLFGVPLSKRTIESLETSEGTVRLFQDIGSIIQSTMEGLPNFDSVIAAASAKAEKRLGKRPRNGQEDTLWMFLPASEYIN